MVTWTLKGGCHTYSGMGMAAKVIPNAMRPMPIPIRKIRSGAVSSTDETYRGIDAFHLAVSRKNH